MDAWSSTGRNAERIPRAALQSLVRDASLFASLRHVLLAATHEGPAAGGRRGVSSADALTAALAVSAVSAAAGVPLWQRLSDMDSSVVRMK